MEVNISNYHCPKRKKNNSQKSEINLQIRNENISDKNPSKNNTKNEKKTKYSLIKKIKKWQKNIPKNSQEKRREAAQIIEQCYKHKQPHINLSNLNLTSLPPCLDALYFIKEITCTNNYISKIPDELFNITSLESINFSNNKIDSIQEDIKKLTHLKSIRLDFNQITNLPKSIEQIATLKKIHISNNQLTIFPKTICNLHNIISLKLEFNQIAQIPESLGQLKKLDSITINNNKIDKIPCSIGELENLKHINLSHNKINNFPHSFRKLTQLKSLNISHNKIHYIPDSFIFLEELETLLAQCNLITSIPENISRLNNIKFINLKKNKIKEIPAELFSIPGLMEINLSDNIINNFPRTLLHNDRLHQIDLYNNNISSLPLSIMKSPYNCLINLKSNNLPVYLSENISTGKGRRELLKDKEQIKIYFSKPDYFYGLIGWHQLAEKNIPLTLSNNTKLNKKIDSILKIAFHSDSFTNSNCRKKIAIRLTQIIGIIDRHKNNSIIDSYLSLIESNSTEIDINDLLYILGSLSSALQSSFKTKLSEWYFFAQAGIAHYRVQLLKPIIEYKACEFKEAGVDKLTLFSYYLDHLPCKPDDYFETILLDKKMKSIPDPVIPEEELSKTADQIISQSLPETYVAILSKWRPWQDKIREINQNKYTSLNAPYIEKANTLKDKKDKMDPAQYNILINKLEAEWLDATGYYYEEATRLQLNRVEIHQSLGISPTQNKTENPWFSWR